MKAKYHRGKGTTRIFLTGIGRDKDLDKFLAGLLRLQLRPKIFPGIYNLNGQGQHALIEKVQRLRSDGYWVAVCDLKEFFLSVDWYRCRRLLRDAGVPNEFHSFFGLTEIQTNWRITHRGLPQGFSCSPWISGIYLSPVLKALNKRYRVFAFVDDLVLVARSRRSVSSGIKRLKTLLARHSYSARLLSIHECGTKRPRILGPADTVQLMGFTLCGVRE